MNEDIQFLKELQKQMRYEDEYDYDGQASPRFWTIGDYKWIVAADGCEERYSVYFPDWAESYELESFLGECKENEDGELSNLAIEAIDNISCNDTALEWIRWYIDGNAYLIPEQEIHFVAPNTMFLTKEEAKKHIELNRHHYTSKVHTYAMTAWRAPKVERLLDILMNMDWDSVEVK